MEHSIATDEGSAKQWLFGLKSSSSHVGFILVTVTLWAIWMARRKTIHEGTFQPPLSTHLFVESFIQDLEVNMQAEKKPSLQPIKCSKRHYCCGFAVTTWGSTWDLPRSLSVLS